MDELISRQDVIDITWEEPSYTDPLNILSERRDKIKSLPLAYPKKGKWVDDGDPLMLTCGNCGYGVMRYNNTPFCPNCGTDMRKDGENSEIN